MPKSSLTFFFFDYFLSRPCLSPLFQLSLFPAMLSNSPLPIGKFPYFCLFLLSHCCALVHKWGVYWLLLRNSSLVLDARAIQLTTKARRSDPADVSVPHSVAKRLRYLPHLRNSCFLVSLTIQAIQLAQCTKQQCRKGRGHTSGHRVTTLPSPGWVHLCRHFVARTQNMEVTSGLGEQQMVHLSCFPEGVNSTANWQHPSC